MTVFGPIKTLKHATARIRVCPSCAINRCLERSDQVGVGLRVRPLCDGRRHHTGPQFVDDLFGKFGVLPGTCRVERLESEPSGQ